MRIQVLFSALALAGALVNLPVAARAASPEVGAPAPDFSFVGEGGVTYRSGDYFSPDQPEQQKGVVIAWFPKAFTSG